MNEAARHLKILESFVLAPEVHRAAVKNPAMLGGPSEVTANFSSRFPFWAWRTLAGCETIHIYPDLRLDLQTCNPSLLNGGGTSRV